jgi:methionyl-tRNA synthetase
MRYYLTTAIPYVNANPHLGFVLEIIQADVYKRFLELQGNKVYFTTGTDENSLKNVISAQEENISPQELVNQNSQYFQDLKELFNLSYDNFIRTTEERHKKGVAKLWQKVFDKGDIYKKEYEGLYCVGCESFYKLEELVNGLCPEHKTKPELIKEENYFFRLSNYQKELEKIITSGKLEIIPEKRKNEVLSFIHQGLEDFSISRSRERAKNWGIAVPNDDSQIVYVWFDALSNYISALDFYKEKSDLFEKWWERADKIIHFIGKGISRFHAIYWPAMLLSADLRLPTAIFVHGYLTINGQKISKSLGGAIDPFEVRKKYGSETIRYFLLREISPFEDGDFSETRLKERYNSDLARGLGNLVSRVLALGEQYGKPISLNYPITQLPITQSLDDYKKYMEEFRFNDALATIWGLISYCDKYISDAKPWEKINDEKEFQKILGELIYILANISLMLLPVMPQTSEKILKFLKLQDISKQDWLSQKVQLEKQVPLFPKKV